MKKSVKFILLGLAALVCVIAAVFTLTAPLTLPLTPAEAGTAALSFTETGLVAADRVVQVYPLAQGELLRVNVAEGDAVKAGDVLCVVDPEPLRLQISQINSGVAGYQAQIANLDAEQDKLRSELLSSKNSLIGELNALKAQERSSGASLETRNLGVEEQLRLQNILIEQNMKDLERAKNDFENISLLYNAGVVSRAEFEAAEAAEAAARSALEAGRQELAVIAGGVGESDEEYYRGMKESLNARIAGIDQSLGKNHAAAMKSYYHALIESSEANAAQLAKDMENCAVTAPADGVVTALHAISTNVAAGGQPVAEITVPGGSMIEAFVSTKDVDSVKAGDTVGLTLKRREGDVSFTGEVAHVDETAIVRLSALGVEERRVKVKVVPHMEGAGGASLGVGYNVDVTFYAYQEENKFTAPKTALFKSGERDMLWVVRNGRAQAVEVTKGMELRTETVIEAGLAPGDFIVNDANNGALKNGVRVQGEV